MEVNVCHFCENHVRVFKYKGVGFCQTCIEDVDNVLKNSVLEPRNETEIAVIELMFFLTFDLKRTRENLIKIGSNYNNKFIENKLHSINSINVECYDISDEVKKKISSLIGEHRMLLSLY